MKKIYLLLLTVLLFSQIGGVKVNANYDSGYSEYDSITFPKNSNGVLLVNLTAQEKKEALNQVRHGFIGWQSYYTCTGVIGNYVGKTIFSRSNTTREAIVFNYSSTLTKSTESTVTTDGNLSVSVNAKGKVLSGGLDAKIRKQVGKTTYDKQVEDTSFKVTINPRCKVSLVAKGDVRVSNGAAKYYFFGICFKSGMWEIVDVMSEYYELCEEKLR